MPRTNQDGKDIRLVVGWLSRRNISDAEMADAVGIPSTTYSRRKDEDDFPTFEHLEKVGEYFGVSSLMLQVAFGYLDINTVLLDEEGLRQYVEQGGGQSPIFPTQRGDSANRRRRRRQDAPPGP